MVFGYQDGKLICAARTRNGFTPVTRAQLFKKFKGLEIHECRWEFDKGDEALAIAVYGSLLLDELELVIQAALDGAGLAWVVEDPVTEHLASGVLVRVLEDWCPPFPGFFLYYPSRRQQPAALAALIAALRV